MGCVLPFQVLDLHAYGLLRQATVIHGNVCYALKVMAELETSGLKDRQLKVWVLRRALKN